MAGGMPPLAPGEVVTNGSRVRGQKAVATLGVLMNTVQLQVGVVNTFTSHLPFAVRDF